MSMRCIFGVINNDTEGKYAMGFWCYQQWHGKRYRASTITRGVYHQIIHHHLHLSTLFQLVLHHHPQFTLFHSILHFFSTITKQSINSTFFSFTQYPISDILLYYLPMTIIYIQCVYTFSIATFYKTKAIYMLYISLISFVVTDNNHFGTISTVCPHPVR